MITHFFTEKIAPKALIFLALILCSGSVFLFADSAKAQTASTTPSTLLFVINLDPVVPRAGDIVNAAIDLNATSFTFSGSSTIQWLVNGIRVASLPGTPWKILFHAPVENGAQVTIQATITLQDGRSGTQTITTFVFDSNTINSYQQNIQNQIQQFQNQYGPVNSPSFIGGISGISDQNAPFTINSDTQNPAPSQTVHLNIQSFLFDADRSFIQWTQDGKKVLEGTGEKNLAVQTGPLGSKTLISAKVTTPQGQIYEKTFTIMPFTASLYWWANTSVPYWYKGKALPTQGSPVYISAFVPTGGSTGKNFVYNWSVNGNPAQNLSGTGRQTLKVIPQLVGLPETVNAQIESIDKTLSFEQTLIINARPPEVYFCIVDILSGCIKGTTSATVQAGDSIDIKANPFYFDSNQLQFLTYTWDIGGQSAKKDPSNPNVLNIKTQTGILGGVQTNVSVKNIITNTSVENSIPINIK